MKSPVVPLNSSTSNIGRHIVEGQVSGEADQLAGNEQVSVRAKNQIVQAQPDRRFPWARRLLRIGRPQAMGCPGPALRGLESGRRTGAGAADVEVAVGTEHHRRWIVEPAGARSDKRAQKGPRAAAVFIDGVGSVAVNIEIAVRSKRQPVGIGKPSGARRDESAKQRPVGL